MEYLLTLKNTNCIINKKTYLIFDDIQNKQTLNLP